MYYIFREVSVDFLILFFPREETSLQTIEFQSRHLATSSFVFPTSEWMPVSGEKFQPTLLMQQGVSCWPKGDHRVWFSCLSTLFSLRIQTYSWFPEFSFQDFCCMTVVTYHMQWNFFWKETQKSGGSLLQVECGLSPEDGTVVVSKRQPSILKM